MFNFIEDVSSLSNSDLLQYSLKLAQHESDVGLRIITCLREAEKRALYSEYGYSSLWDFATLGLKLSSGNAQVKIDAMRLTRENPIAKEKIESGELSLLNAAKVNSFLRQEKRVGKTYSPEQRAEVIESVIGLSKSECERALLARSPEAIPAEKIRPLTETQTELKIVLNTKTMNGLQRLKELLSNQIPLASVAELLEYLVEEKVESLEKKQMGTEQSKPIGQSDQQVATPTVEVKDSRVEEKELVSISTPPTPRKYISVNDRSWVMRRAQGQCENISKDGRRCSSRHQLHIDHILPLALGGHNERSNYRVLCSNCNRYFAKLNLGEIMNQYVPSFR